MINHDQMITIFHVEVKGSSQPMKQLVQNMRNGITDIIEVPIPNVRPGTALVKTVVSLVSSGTERMIAEFAEKNLLEKARSRPDLVKQVVEKSRRDGIIQTAETVLNRLDQSLYLGYSSAGTILELGEDMADFRIGDRVSCAGSGHAVHAEYAVIPKNLLTKIPDSVDFESAAFTTVGAIALHGFRLAEPQIGDRVAVIGLGLLGMLSVQIARVAGCKVFGIDLDPERVDMCKNIGIEASTRGDSPSVGLAYTNGNGFDIILICADSRSNDPIELAGNLARSRARIIAVGAVGLEIPRKLYYEKELTLLVSRSYGPGRYDQNYEEKGIDYPPGYVRWTEGRNFSAFLDLIADQKITLHPLITHRYPIQNGAEAYQLIKNKSDSNYLGVILTYDSNDQGSQSNRRVRLNHKKSLSVSTSKLRIGVLGAGNYANAVFLPAIKNDPHTELVAIASANGLSARQTGSKFKFQYAASDENEIYKDPDIDAVVILTRHNMHSTQVVNALGNGKHVFCEKPIVISEQELDEVSSVYQDSESRQLTVGYNRRFSPFISTIKNKFLNRSEPIFINYRINAGYLPKDHWLHDPLQGGGRLVGEVCHFIDLCVFLVGLVPVSTTASAMADSNKYYQDNLAITLEFGDGSIAVIEYVANGSKIQSKEQIEIFYCGKSSIIDDFRSLILFEDNKKSENRSYLRQEKGHKEIWSSFVNGILESKDPIIPYDQIWGVSKSTFRILETLRTRQRTSIPPY